MTIDLRHARAVTHLRWLARVLLIALVYAVMNYLLSRYLRQMKVTYPISVGGGVALAAVMCWGRVTLLAPFLGHCLFVWAISRDSASFSWLGTACFGLSAVVQAWAGVWLLQRLTKHPLELSQPRDVALFAMLCGLAIPVVGASADLLALIFAYGFSQPAQMPATWVDFWTSKANGLLIGTPIMLALIAKPQRLWAPRRVSMVLPLLLAAGLVILGQGAISRWDQQRQTSAFEREAALSANAVQGVLREPVSVLAATRGVLSVQEELSTAAFQAATASYLVPGGVVDFLGYAALLPSHGERLARFVAAAKADGHSSFKVHDTTLPFAAVAPPGEPLLVIRHIEPLARSPDTTMGLNLRSTRSARVALELAERSGLPVAAEAFASRLGGGSTGVRVVLFQAVYEGKPASDAARLAAFRGAVLVALDPQMLLDGAVKNIDSPLLSCLTDDDPNARLRLLAGRPDCESHSLLRPELQYHLSYGGRAWTLHLSSADASPWHRSVSAQLFAVAGTVSLALLLIVLLTSSGRTQRIETLAEQRGTELQETSRELRRNEQRFRSVFENAPVGIFVSRLDGIPTEANPQFLRMLGCPPDELLERYRPHTEADAAIAQHLVEQADGSVQLQRELHRLDGTSVQALLLMSLQRDPEGRPDALLCVAQDITAHLQFEANARAREAAELSNRTKSEFLSHMSHELRTPLNGMLGFTQLLQLDSDRRLSTQQKEWIAKIGQAGWHLLAMINDVLDLSRIETGNLKVTLGRQDVHRLVDDVKALLTPAAQRRGITVRTRLSAQARHAVGDLTRMQEIISNLLSNAIKYNTEGGRVLISARRVDSSYVHISVTDTGPGLSSQQLASMFQPFNRLGQERGNIEGTGIGLVISRRLAELMYGSLKVGSRLGKGTTFTLRLPAAEGEMQTFLPVAPAFIGAPWNQRRRLVYIEDNAVNIEVMRAVIAQRPMADLAVFEDGSSGLAAVLANPPELLLLDMQLPDTDGLSLLRKLREAPQCAAVITIMVSADALDDQIRLCLEAGARNYLTKPFNIRELLSLLDELLAGNGTSV